MRESDIEKYLVKEVKELGGLVRKVQWIGAHAAPDRIVMFGTAKAVNRLNDVLAQSRSGHVVDASALLYELLGLVSAWPEIKAPGKKPEPHQLREHDRMRALGMHVVVIDSFDGVDELLS